MPTPEEIKKLSDAYAEYMCPVGDYCGGVYDDQRNTDLPIYKDDAKSVLEWLSKDYCIVPKSQLVELITKNRYYKDYNSLSQTFPEDLIPERTNWGSMRNYADGLYYLIEDIIFLSGTELFNEND